MSTVISYENEYFDPVTEEEALILSKPAGTGNRNSYLKNNISISDLNENNEYTG